MEVYKITMEIFVLASDKHIRNIETSQILINYWENAV